MKGFCESFSSKVELDTWRPFFFYALAEGLPPDVPSGFMAHLKSFSVLPRSAKHKADAHAFFTYREDKSFMPLHFYTDVRVLKVDGLFPTVDADPRALEALRVSFCVLDHASLPPPIAPTATPNRLPLRYIPCFIFNKTLNVRCDSPVTLEPVVENARGQYSATVVLESEYQGGINSLTPRTPSLIPLPTPELRPRGSSTSPPGGSLPSRKSGSSSRAGQLEGELKALKDEKTREAKALQRQLKTLAYEHSIMQERYGAIVRRTEAVRASLEGVQAERDYAVKDRDAATRERDILRVGGDAMLQTHDRLLDHLIESQS
ncbi:hypothetical protein LIER_32659 [Lithospermum erythrorhizon]|uniref:Uncharacterized protein n=1 Tax=Lithospermum erythrorhizon TaxID=34254 RepID=A0AAV3RZU2_LITER